MAAGQQTVLRMNTLCFIAMACIGQSSLLAIMPGNVANARHLRQAFLMAFMCMAQCSQHDLWIVVFLHG